MKWMEKIFIGAAVLVLGGGVSAAGWAIVKNEVQDKEISYIVKSMDELKVSINRALDKLERSCRVD